MFGWDDLRPEQLDAMEAVLAGRDVLALMASGSGKSAIYQVPAALGDGHTVVVSPLIALQDDQIAGLKATDAPAAVAVNSSQPQAKNSASWTAFEQDDATYLYLAPEQLSNSDVVAHLKGIGISLLVVDEAHCVSAWGHDFRPSYLGLARAIDELGRPPVAALTATASPIVRREIVELLGLRDPVIIDGGFDRPNLRLEVELHVRDREKRAAVVSTVRRLSGPGLLYCATRRDTEKYAQSLAEGGLRTAAYHAGLTGSERSRVHDDFRRGVLDVVAATSAFGMGIDKPDVRFVAHASIPDSLDNYYQQIGRGGRDGDDALALLFYRSEDLGLAKFFTAHRPDEELLRTVFSTLQGAERKRLTDLRTETGIRGRKLTNAVNLLEQAGALAADGRGFVRCTDDEDAAVSAALDVVATRERVDRSRVEMMRGYAETRSCRRQFLLAYFGETLASRCGNCDRCSDNGSDDSSFETAHDGLPVDATVDHREWGSGVVINTDTDRITVLFDDYGYRTLALEAIRENGVLTRRCSADTADQGETSARSKRIPCRP
jgi:ATP-dependent DNA helicase RecQ